MEPHQQQPLPKRRLVDSFVAAPQTAPSAAPRLKPRPIGVSGVDGMLPVKRKPQAISQPHPSSQMQARLHQPHPHAPKPAQPVRNIEGIVVKPPLQRAAPTPPPAKPARAFPEGPLHLRYQNRPAGPESVAPATKPIARPATQPIAKPRERQLSEEELEEKLVKAITTPLKQTTESRAKKAVRVSAWAIVGLVIIGGLSLFSQAVGEAALAVYAVVALWRRWPSQQTFALALAMFAGIIISSLLSSVGISQFDGLQQISENLAVYAFLLLCIGTVALAREVRNDGRSVHKVSP